MIPLPIGDRVLAKALDEERAGLWLPDGGRGHAQRGIVMEKGDEVRYLEVGDEILFTLHRAVEISHDGEALHVLPETDVLLILSRAEVNA